MEGGSAGRGIRASPLDARQGSISATQPQRKELEAQLAGTAQRASVTHKSCVGRPQNNRYPALCVLLNALEAQDTDFLFFHFQRPPKPPLWWLLRRAMPLVYGSAGLASLLAVRATGDGGSLLNAVSLLVRKNGTTESVSSNNYARTALALYGCALLMDVMWSPLLHGAKRIGEAAVLRAAAATTLACTIPLMAIGVNPLAGALLLPLFAWECSGAYWNYALYRLNGSSIREKRRHRDTHGYTTLGEE